MVRIASNVFASTHHFFESARAFIYVFNVWSGRMRPDAVADHICYKCADAKEFEHIRSLFESESAFVYQSIISNRRISIIKFTQPIPTSLGEIWFLELSDQKPDGSQTSGFDHIEIYPVSGTMEALAESLESKGQTFKKVVRPHHTTYDAAIYETFKVRLEPEALIEKIKASEMIA